MNDVLASYIQKVEHKIAETIPFMGPPSVLRDACQYALTNGGKRLRPVIALMVADAIGAGADVLDAALSIELFHTASLVADDLPCMDDDGQRRNKPSLHTVYGEGVALLASYALISEGYNRIAKNTQTLKATPLPHTHLSDEICVIALQNASINTGLWGAAGGQFEDIAPKNLSLETLQEIIVKKTVSLYEIAFVFGWVFGGGRLDKLALVKKAANHFGMAFQLADDLGDEEQDASKGRLVNIANAFGRHQALEMFHGEITAYLQTIKELEIETPELVGLSDMVVSSVVAI